MGDALNGTWSTGGVWWGSKKARSTWCPSADDVPAETKAKVDAIKAGLKDGSASPSGRARSWARTGKEVLAKDVVADDKFLGGVKFYVKGVEGKVPN